MSTYFFIMSITVAFVISTSLLIGLIYNFWWKKKSKKIVSAFVNTADNFDLNNGKYDVFNKGVIGLNELVFQETTEGKQHRVVVDLKNIETCFGSVKTIWLQLDLKNRVKPGF